MYAVCTVALWKYLSCFCWQFFWQSCVLNSNRHMPSVTNPQTDPTFWSPNNSGQIPGDDSKNHQSSAVSQYWRHTSQSHDACRHRRIPLFNLLPPFSRNAAFLVLIVVHMDTICLGLPEFSICHLTYYKTLKLLFQLSATWLNWFWRAMDITPFHKSLVCH